MDDVIEPKIGVLIVNLGTPKSTDYWAIRAYLSEFLSDKRMIELSPWIWQPILQGIILTFRPLKLSRSYKRIWDKVANTSPLQRITESQADKLSKKFEKTMVIVDWAMRYGEPKLEKKLLSLINQNCTRILILPMFPQYSATTTASVNDVVFKTLLTCRKQPAIRTVYSFADDKEYIQALKAAIEQKLSQENCNPERILLSYHGLPQSYVAKGDPYEEECNKTTCALRRLMGLTEKEMPHVYQSEFGPSRWLKPNIKKVIRRYLAQGIKHIAVVAPGFVVDSMETLEEIDREYRRMFLRGGGKSFIYVPCLNDSDLAINFLEQFVFKESAGWY
ncbi:Ferrochelatase [Commensalibacter sp. Nvir]|uniref:ferrochelatase n=1 Tax=Commensalibacter sp. Nvir TaxID=3069817 RepID=UPI002D29BA5C|nr:Ferrochelatase [Commensalibacter sp. Nvir]